MTEKKDQMPKKVNEDDLSLPDESPTKMKKQEKKQKGNKHEEEIEQDMQDEDDTHDEMEYDEEEEGGQDEEGGGEDDEGGEEDDEGDEEDDEGGEEGDEGGGEEEEDEDEEGETENDAKKRRDRSRKAKLSGYRSLAKKSGFKSKGLDQFQSLLSEADARRLMTFIPISAMQTDRSDSKTSFDVEEFELRHNLFKRGVPFSSSRETASRCDSVLRSIINKAVLRSVENGKKTLSASLVQSILREPSKNMIFTSVVPPLGLIRHAQKQGILSTSENDLACKQDEKKQSIAIKKISNEWQKSEKARLDKRREELVAKKAAVN